MHAGSILPANLISHVHKMSDFTNTAVSGLSAAADYKLKLSYFGIEGAAEKVRLAFHISDLDWEDNRVAFADWPEMKKKVPNGQLPVLEVIDKSNPSKVVTVTQSAAMCRCLGLFSKNGCALIPTDPVMHMQMEVMLGYFDDDSRAFNPALYMGMNPTKLGHPEGFQKTDEGKALILDLRTKYIADDLPKYAGLMSDALASGPYLCGDSMNLADIFWLVRCRYLQSGVADGIPKTCLDAYPSVKDWYARMMSDEKIVEWYKRNPNKNLGEE